MEPQFQVFKQQLKEAFDNGDINSIINVLVNDSFANAEFSYTTVKSLLLDNKPNNENITVSLIHFITFKIMHQGYDVPLVSYLLNGNVAEARQNLQSDPEMLQNPVWNDVTPVRYVFRSLNPEYRISMLKLLVEFGYNLLERDADGANLLQQLAFHSGPLDQQNFQLAKYLYAAGVPVEASDNFGITVLHEAVVSNNHQLISYLIRRGADVNYKNPFTGCSALHLACENNSTSLICLLIYYGANITESDSLNRTPIDLVPEEGEQAQQSRQALARGIAKLIFKHIETGVFQANNQLRNYINHCTEELETNHVLFHSHHRMSTLLFLTKKLNVLANLTQNHEAVLLFQTRMNTFDHFRQDLMIVLQEAITLREESDNVQLRIYHTFVDRLPSLIVRKMAKYLVPEDLPLE